MEEGEQPAPAATPLPAPPAAAAPTSRVRFVHKDVIKAWVVGHVPQLLMVDEYLVGRNAWEGDPVVGFRCPCLEGRVKDAVHVTRLGDLKDHLDSMVHKTCKRTMCGRSGLRSSGLPERGGVGGVWGGRCGFFFPRWLTLLSFPRPPPPASRPRPFPCA